MADKFSVDSFIQRSADISDLQSLVSLIRELFSALDFESISYHIVRRSFRSIPANDGTRVTGNPHLRDALFAPGQSVGFDPVIASLLEKLEPYHWFEAENDDRLSEPQKRIFAMLRAEGFVDGIAIPIMTRPGELAVFALSKRGKSFPLSKSVLRKLQVACHAMHLRFEELANGDADMHLSARETDVMRLVARGRTNKEIALALRLSSHTVDTLIRRCFSKLGVSNRIEASIMFTFRDKLSA